MRAESSPTSGMKRHHRTGRWRQFIANLCGLEHAAGGRHESPTPAPAADQPGALAPDQYALPSCSRIAGFSSVLVSCVIASPLAMRAQQPPHDLAAAGLGQVVAEADVLGLGDRADLLGRPSRAARWRSCLASSPVGRERLSTTKAQIASPVVSSGLPTTAASATSSVHADQRRFDLHRAHAVARDVEHVVDAPGDAEVARSSRRAPRRRRPGSSVPLISAGK